MNKKLKEKISDFAYNEGLSDVRFTDPKVDFTEFNRFKEFIQKGYHGQMDWLNNNIGWRGNPRQWQLQVVAGILLSALMLPIFVSVHSIVSWDFAVTPAVEGLHSTIFAPYFVIGAVHSGVSAVVTMMC